MKFFSFFYNPFAAIRRLEAANATLAANLSDARDANYFLRQQRDFAIDAGFGAAELADDALAGLDVADFAVDHFMAEREELKTSIAILEADARIQASETLEVVAYVKQVGARLAAAGIEIVDTENGPQVVVDENKFVTAVHGSLSITGGQRILQAA